MADAERLVQRVRVTLVIPIVLEPGGALVKGEVIRVPHRTGPAFRTWEQLLELAQREAVKDLSSDDQRDPATP